MTIGPTGGSPDAADDSPGAGGDAVAEILLHWWAYGALPGEGLPISCHRVSETLEPPVTTVRETVQRLSAHLASPLTDHATSSFEEQALAFPEAATPGLSTFLDVWLDCQFSELDLWSFENALVDTNDAFCVSWPDRREVTAPLSVLCAMRLAPFLVREPNPLFFFFPPIGFDREAFGQGYFLDLRWFLPTRTSRNTRVKLLAEKPVIGVSPAYQYVASSFLPEFLGQFSLSDHLDNENRHFLPASIHTEHNSRFLLGNLEPKRSIWFAASNIPIARYFVLGVAQLAKKLLERSAEYGSWKLRVVQRLTGPSKAKRWFTRSEFQHLWKLAQRREWVRHVD